MAIMMETSKFEGCGSVSDDDEEKVSPLQVRLKRRIDRELRKRNYETRETLNDIINQALEHYFSSRNATTGASEDFKAKDKVDVNATLKSIMDGIVEIQRQHADYLKLLNQLNSGKKE